MPHGSYWVYVGVTDDLARRIEEHRQGKAGSFTTRYRVHRLVYAEEHRTARDAILREKTIKGWTRAKKVAFIEATNPDWADLSMP